MVLKTKENYIFPSWKALSVTSTNSRTFLSFIAFTPIAWLYSINFAEGQNFAYKKVSYKKWMYKKLDTDVILLDTHVTVRLLRPWCVCGGGGENISLRLTTSYNYIKIELVYKKTNCIS